MPRRKKAAAANSNAVLEGVEDTAATNARESNINVLEGVEDAAAANVK